MTNGNDQINQQIETDVDFADVNYEKQYGRTYSYGTGLTKREYFAAMAMQGLLAKYNLKEPSDQQIISQMALELADSLITELNKKP